MALAKQLQFLGTFCSTFPQSQVFMLLLKILSLQSCNCSLHPKESCLSHEENARAGELGLNVDPMATTGCCGPDIVLGVAAGEAKLSDTHMPLPREHWHGRARGLSQVWGGVVCQQLGVLPLWGLPVRGRCQ